jgi:hypothetical protein
MPARFFVDAVERGGLRQSLPSGRALRGPVGLQPALRAGFSSFNAAMPPVSPSRRRCFAPGVIRVDDALCGAARCRGAALCQRGIGAFKVIVGHAPLVDLQADRIGRVIRLGESRCRCQNARHRQNCQSRNAHSKSPLRLQTWPARHRDRRPALRRQLSGDLAWHVDRQASLIRATLAIVYRTRAAPFALLRRAGTYLDTCKVGPGSAAHHAAKCGALRSIRGTTAC